MLMVKNIKLPVDADEKQLKVLLEKKFRHKINSYQIAKKSLDARKTPVYVYSLLVDIDKEEKYLSKDIRLYEKENLLPQYKKRNRHCIITGYGPSGIFSALFLTQAGFSVEVFEMGKRIKDREKDVESFFKGGPFDPHSNVQFGEGGAGTFSDAKLTTRIKDKYISYILEQFIAYGANPSILYENHSHIGTDEIRKIIAAITDDLISKGVLFHFEEEMKEILLNEDHEVIGIKTDKGEYDCDELLLGIGHSAYESIQSLKKKDVYIEKKDIALGFRVEHPQDFIDQRQTNSIIETANEYFLRYKAEKGVYSFCMCPGGMVIPAMGQDHTVVTNGMSYAARDSGVANAAILIQVFKDEFEDGFAYLHQIESDAYAYSESYNALAQNISDFMEGKLEPLIFPSTYPLGTVLYDFNQLFKTDDLSILKKAFLDFDRKIPGFIDKGIMVGPETRSSCPVRILRNQHLQSVNTKHLYPMGEGAGYGGGIMSCALDGIRIANEIIKYDEQI